MCNFIHVATSKKIIARVFLWIQSVEALTITTVVTFFVYNQ